MIDIRGVAPLLQVFDMQRSIAFYRDLLGFTLKQSAGPPGDIGWCLLELHGVELMLNTAYETPHRPPAPNAARVAAHGDTILYFGAPDVDAVWRVDADGVWRCVVDIMNEGPPAAK